MIFGQNPDLWQHLQCNVGPNPTAKEVGFILWRFPIQLIGVELTLPRECIMMKLFHGAINYLWTEALIKIEDTVKFTLHIYMSVRMA